MGGRHHRRASRSDSSSGSDSDSSSEDDKSHRRQKKNTRSSSKSKSKSSRDRDGGRRSSRSRDTPRARLPPRETQYFDMGRDGRPPSALPVYRTRELAPMGTKIAMILLLGPEEREFRLTEAHILFDSPNDLTSTFYASTESSEVGGQAKTYRLPDRDAAIFEIIFRYLNREQVLPLRKSLCPTYLSYEQTIVKLAEEAKFYRFQKLQRALPPVQSTPANEAVPLLPYANQAPVQPRPVSAVPSQVYNLTPMGGQPPPQGMASQLRAHIPVDYPAASVPQPSMAPPPSIAPSSLFPAGSDCPRPNSSLQLPAPATPYTSRSRSSSRAPSIAPADEPRTARPITRPPSRAGSRRTSLEEPLDATVAPPQTLFAYIYRPGQYGIRAGQQPYQLIDYPDDAPIPHLFIRVTNAELIFSAFRSAHDPELYELRWSLRVLDEPSTRALAYRVRDSTIKAIDSHLRLNGAIGDVSCRDIPVRMQHLLPSHPQRGTSREVTDDNESVTTGDLEELLDLITTKGYVKWPRVWQDSFDNVTPPDSLHQRVCLSSCEVLLDLEFPEDTAEISAEVGGRGLTLDEQEKEELTVRNYKAVIHSIKCETRKIRRLKELESVNMDSTLAKQVRDKLVVEPPAATSERSRDRLRSDSSQSVSRSNSRDRYQDNGNLTATSRSHSRQSSRTPSYDNRMPSARTPHIDDLGPDSRYSPQKTRPMDTPRPPSAYQFSDPGTAMARDTQAASHLELPGQSDYYSRQARRPTSVRSTVSEEIKRQVMESW